MTFISEFIPTEECPKIMPGKYKKYVYSYEKTWPDTTYEEVLYEIKQFSECERQYLKRYEEGYTGFNEWSIKEFQDKINFVDKLLEDLKNEYPNQTQD